MAYQVNPVLLGKLPRTFVPALNEQIHNWDVLFPAERRALSSQMDWLASLPDADFKTLFDPIFAVEQRMALPAWNPATDRMSVTDTGILVRSPYYQQWRAAVEQAFSKIEAGIEAQGKRKRSNKLIVATMPAGLAPRTGALWPKLEKEGKWITLPQPFAEILPTLYRKVAARERRPEVEALESTWVFEYNPVLAELPVEAPVIGLSFEKLGSLRREFLLRLNRMKRDLNTLDLTYDELRKLDMRPWFPGDGNAGVREFTRNLFLSGNGALLFGNSFVQWGASEAFRRAAPQATFCRFSVRPKLKPFSGVVLFEDQNRANPVPDQPDPEGSFVDCQLLMEYIHLAALRGTEYAGRLLALIAVPDEKRVLAIGAIPPNLNGAEISDAALNWVTAS